MKFTFSLTKFAIVCGAAPQRLAIQPFCSSTIITIHIFFSKFNAQIKAVIMHLLLDHSDNISDSAVGELHR